MNQKRTAYAELAAARKLSLLLRILDDRALDVDRALVFPRTKHGANKVAKQLDGASVTRAQQR